MIGCSVDFQTKSRRPTKRLSTSSRRSRSERQANVSPNLFENATTLPHTHRAAICIVISASIGCFFLAFLCSYYNDFCAYYPFVWWAVMQAASRRVICSQWFTQMCGKRWFVKEPNVGACVWLQLNHFPGPQRIAHYQPTTHRAGLAPKQILIGLCSHASSVPAALSPPQRHTMMSSIFEEATKSVWRNHEASMSHTHTHPLASFRLASPIRMAPCKWSFVFSMSYKYVLQCE